MLAGVVATVKEEGMVETLLLEISACFDIFSLSPNPLFLIEGEKGEDYFKFLADCLQGLLL